MAGYDFDYIKNSRFQTAETLQRIEHTVSLLASSNTPPSRNQYFLGINTQKMNEVNTIITELQAIVKNNSRFRVDTNELSTRSFLIVVNQKQNWSNQFEEPVSRVSIVISDDAAYPSDWEVTVGSSSAVKKTIFNYTNRSSLYQQARTHGALP